MKYPQDLPSSFQTQTELLAWLFGALSNVYNMLAQYEAEDREAEEQKFKDDLFGIFEERKGQNKPAESAEEND